MTRKYRLEEMRNLRVIILITIMLTAIPISSQTSQESKVYVVGMEVIVENLGQKSYPLDDLKNMILIPEDEHQKLMSFYCEINGVEVKWKILGLDENGNIKVKLLNAPETLPAKSKLTLKMLLEVQISKRRAPRISVEEAGNISDIPKALIEKYCVMKGIWSKSSNVTSLAKAMAKNETNILRLLCKFIKWIEENIKYPEPIGGEPKIPTYPDDTIKIKVGDCDDQANLLVAMCRAVNIPAFTQLAFIFMEGKKSKREGILGGHLTIETINLAGHGWAAVYIPPWGWLPVDMTYFVGARYKSGRIISINAEDHITGAAAFHNVIVITENVVYSDYIKELNDWIRDLKEYNLKWTDRYWMKVKVTRLPDGVVSAAIGGLAVLTVATLAVYMYARSRRRKLEEQMDQQVQNK